MCSRPESFTRIPDLGVTRFPADDRVDAVEAQVAAEPALVPRRLPARVDVRVDLGLPGCGIQAGLVLFPLRPGSLLVWHRGPRLGSSLRNAQSFHNVDTLVSTHHVFLQLLVSGLYLGLVAAVLPVAGSESVVPDHAFSAAAVGLFQHSGFLPSPVHAPHTSLSITPGGLPV